MIFENMYIDSDNTKDFLRREGGEEIGRIAEGYVSAVVERDFDYYITSKEIVGFLNSVSLDIHTRGIKL